MKNTGMVLISVLWVVLVLSLVSFSLASAVRVEMLASEASFDSDRAFFMAKGAAEVVYRSFSNKQDLPDDSPVRRENGIYVFPFETGEARVRFESNMGLIDINNAPDKLLASMFDSLGMEQDTRNHLVDSMLDWRDNDDIPHLYGAEVDDYAVTGGDPSRGTSRRPRNIAFQTVDELLLVKNMTPGVFYGSLALDPRTGQYRRIPGVRDLVTVSGSATVDPNLAAGDVLNALPQIEPDTVERILAERAKKQFAGIDDFVKRVPEMFQTETLEYVSFQGQLPSVLVSTATISSSGVSRTVRVLFRREERIQLLRPNPLIYRRTEEIRFNRWRYD